MVNPPAQGPEADAKEIGRYLVLSRQRWEDVARHICTDSVASVKGTRDEEMEVRETKTEEAQGIQSENGMNVDSRDIWNLGYVQVCISTPGGGGPR